MKFKKQLIAILVIALAYLAGRYSSPSEVEIREVEKIVYKESKSKDQNENIKKHKKKTVLPDGTIIEEEISEKEKETRTKTETQIDQEKESYSKITNRPSWSVGLVYEPAIKGFQQVHYTGLIEKRMFGEVYLGLAGSDEGTFGLVFRLGF